MTRRTFSNFGDLDCQVLLLLQRQGINEVLPTRHSGGHTPSPQKPLHAICLMTIVLQSKWVDIFWWVLPDGVFPGGYCHVGYFQADIARWAFVGGWVGLTIGGKACLLQLDSRKTFLRFAYICSCSHHAHHLHHQHHH